MGRAKCRWLNAGANALLAARCCIEKIDVLTSLIGGSVASQPLDQRKWDALPASPAVDNREGCGSAHHWGRELQAMEFEVRLVPATCVKPLAERLVNDAADAMLFRDLGRLLLEHIGDLDAKDRKRARASEEAKRLTAIPGIGRPSARSGRSSLITART